MIIVAVTLAACAGTTGTGRDEQVEFAAESAADNILTTDYTALVEITGAQAKQAAQPDDGNDDEAVLRIDYTATVLETFLGEKLETIVFSRYAARQEGLEDPQRGTWIVSLCRDRDGTYYLPGVGYELPPDEAVLAVARQTSAQLAGGELSLRRSEGGYACLPEPAR